MCMLPPASFSLQLQPQNKKIMNTLKALEMAKKLAVITPLMAEKNSCNGST